MKSALCSRGMRFPYCTLAALAVPALGALSTMSACLSVPGDTAEPATTAAPGTNASLAFASPGTLKLAPGETTAVEVQATPPDHYELSFYLVGAALDASLSPASMMADGDGHASVTMRAPNSATSYVLRATITDGPSADLQVAVSDKGFGSLRIEPSYAGTRTTDQWIAKVVSGTSCAALSAALPEDPAGALTATAAPGEPLIVDVAPVGPNLAVVVRGGHYMWGCADEPNLVAGEVLGGEVPIVN